MDGKIEGEGTSGEHRQDKGNELQSGRRSGGELGKYPCGICRKGVGRNSARFCTSCKKWMHKRCGGVVGRLAKVGDFKCRNSSEGGARVVDGVSQFVLRAREELEVVDKFCYLCDVIGKGGGAEEASRARVRS